MSRNIQGATSPSRAAVQSGTPARRRPVEKEKRALALRAPRSSVEFIIDPVFERFALGRRGLRTGRRSAVSGHPVDSGQPDGFVVIIRNVGVLPILSRFPIEVPPTDVIDVL
jgi:hypothetical protein